MAKSGPEAGLVKKMRDAGRENYGERLVTIKYHGDIYAEAGVSDLLCALDGIFIAVEVKHPKNYGNSVERALAKGPTLKQRAFVARVLAAGGCAGFAADVEGFSAILDHAVERAESGADPGVYHCGGHNI